MCVGTSELSVAWLSCEWYCEFVVRRCVLDLEYGGLVIVVEIVKKMYLFYFCIDEVSMC